MAEAITNTMHKEDWTAISAGTKPAGYVHPFALKVLEELNIIHIGSSKSVDELKGMDLDLVITVCDEADQDCPVWLGSGEKIHLGFKDPAGATGTEEEILKVFRDVRDQIQKQLSIILDS